MTAIKPGLQKYFSFCPHCGKRFILKTIHGGKELLCRTCGFIFWLNSKPAVSAFLVKGKKVLLAKRAINPRKGYWDVFGGFTEIHEEPLHGLRREMFEELGILIGKPSFLGFYMGEYGRSPQQSTLNIYYIVRSWKGTLRPQDDVASGKWFPVTKLPKRIAFAYMKQAFRDIKKALA